jgi:hypothetical protein
VPRQVTAAITAMLGMAGGTMFAAVRLSDP